MAQQKKKETRSKSLENEVALPVSRGHRSETAEQRLNAIVRELESRPGLRVLQVQSQDPRHESRIPVAIARSTFINYNPNWSELRQGADIRAEFSDYSYIGTGPYITDVYHGSNRLFREYRKNFLISGCIDARAFWATKEGFDTELEPVGKIFANNEQGKAEREAYLKPYEPLKAYIDRQNENIGLDQQLEIALIVSRIVGRCAFEYEDDGKDFTRWVVFDPDDILPINSRKKRRLGYSYKGQGTAGSPAYKPDDIFYYVNKDLDGRGYGLSDVEAVLKESQLDDKIIREDLTEAATTMWAPQILLWLDIDRIPLKWTKADIDRVLSAQVAAMAPGKITASDNRFSAQEITVKPDLAGLIGVSDKCERRILGHFKVPRFMLNLEYQGWNRATSYTELETFVDGPVTKDQKALVRAVEQQWYNKLTFLYLSENDASWSEGDPFPVRARLRPRQIRTSDMLEWIKVVAAAYNGGNGFIDELKAYEMMQKGTATPFDKKEIEERQNATVRAVREFKQKEMQVPTDVKPQQQQPQQ